MNLRRCEADACIEIKHRFFTSETLFSLSSVLTPNYFQPLSVPL